MAMIMGKDAQFVMQTKDGEVIELTGMVTDYKIGKHVDTVNFNTFGGNTHIVPTGHSITAEFTIVGSDVNFFTYSEHKHRELSKERRSQDEWACVYCHRPNLRERTTCEGCGAVRSFIYD